jgi:hypothetical protein
LTPKYAKGEPKKMTNKKLRRQAQTKELQNGNNKTEKIIEKKIYYPSIKFA